VECGLGVTPREESCLGAVSLAPRPCVHHACDEQLATTPGQHVVAHAEWWLLPALRLALELEKHLTGL
jgi:hypothetical protein